MRREKLITEILSKFHGEKYATYWQWEALDEAIIDSARLKPQLVKGMDVPTRGRFLLEQLSKATLVKVNSWVDEYNDF